MAHQLEPPFKKVKPEEEEPEEKEPEQEEPEESGLKLNDLPELPFELILSFLSLEDRIKARVVSRRWCRTIDGFRVKILCFSDHSRNLVLGNNRWISGMFAENFICSRRFESFFRTFGQSILSNLKHLRLCKLDLKAKNTPTSLARILNSFDQLEVLDLFNIKNHHWFERDEDLQLNLPVLKSFQLFNVSIIGDQLTLNAPRLQKVNHLFSPKVDLVHGESVDTLIIHNLDYLKVEKLKNLKYLYCGSRSVIDSTLLSTLEQLNEIHLSNRFDIVSLFEQKERYGRVNLKIFLRGCLLNGPSDPAIGSLGYDKEGYLVTLANHHSRLADEVPHCYQFRYSAIEAVAPGLEIDLWSRFTNLFTICLGSPVRDVERFLKLLKNLNISNLNFGYCDQPQQLFDQLPDHCAITWLRIYKAPADWDFLFRMKSLINLRLNFAIDIEFIRKFFEKLPFFTKIAFYYLHRNFSIRVNHSKRFTVSLLDREKTNVSDVNAAVQWIKEKGIESEDEDSEDSEDEEYYY